MPRKKKLKSDKNGVWQILLDALSKKVGEIVPNEELIRVSGQHNYARRIRELRAEGWQIKYSQSPQGYILLSDEKVEKDTDAYINLKLRQKVLERDNHICQLCGHSSKETYSDGEQVKLEVDHITPLKQSGRTVEENLWVLCSRCNAGKKSLLDYPETLKNKIITLNLPNDLRNTLANASLKTGKTINSLILDTLRKKFK